MDLPSGSSSEEQPPADDRIELEPDLAPGMEPEEGDPTRRYVKKQGALQQGTNIPVGWKPTVRAPIPVVRCIHVFKDGHPKEGERCGRWSLRGSQLCYIHSGRGNLKNVEEYRQSIIETARLQLTEAVPDAMATLLHLAAQSPADNVRLKAATEILDRAGIKTAEELNVNLEVTAANPAMTLAERLAGLKKAADLQRDMEDRLESAATAAAEAAAVAAGAPVSRFELEAPDATADTVTVVNDGEVIEGEIVE